MLVNIKGNKRPPFFCMATLRCLEAYWLIWQVLQVTINATILILILVGVDGEKRLVAAPAAATFVEDEVDDRATAVHPSRDHD